PQRASQRTHLQVTTSLETLLALPGAPAAEMEHSLPVSSRTVERLACDCSVTRILLDSESMVIDVGRAKRTISGPQRKALNVRDKHCVWPGCERPASWTEGHHRVHWLHGGGGDLPNLALLCHRHHWLVHEGNWQIVRGDDGRMLTIPPLVSFGSPSRDPD
ncbi:MAG TPA: HNH endonuclease, partial [Candidatus Dormibacteraeota bacterium]